MPRLHLAAVVSSKGDVVRADLPEIRVYATPAQAFSNQDIDAIVIATPNDTHFPLAMAALRAGKHVVVDKPFTITGKRSKVPS